ncbi:MAG: SsrA-binding protein SmpB [Acidimicrobiia bacterium]
MSPPGTKPVASNRKARHDYSILDTYEAGIQLVGSEVKSIRDGKVQMADAYASVERGQLFLYNVHVAPYGFAHGFGAHDPDRSRKLLMHRSEIDRIGARVAQERLTLVPLELYFKDGRVKVTLALAKGRTHADKRSAMAERDAKKEMAKALGRSAKGMD